MPGPELPYKISLSEEELACLRKITKIIDDLCLDLIKMCLHRNEVHHLNQTMLQNFKLQMQPQAVPVHDFSLSEITYQKILVSYDLGPDIDPVQAINRFFIKLSNHEPHTTRHRNQTRFFTPLSCDLEPDISFPVTDLYISKVTHQKIFFSSDLGPDLDPVQTIT